MEGSNDICVYILLLLPAVFILGGIIGKRTGFKEGTKKGIEKGKKAGEAEALKGLEAKVKEFLK